MRKMMLVFLAFVFIASTAFAAQGTAVPASTLTFDGGNCTAKFVRSASGIINETNRKCGPPQNPWTSLDVYLQFRPVGGTPNPDCDPTGLVTQQFEFSTTETPLTTYFFPGAPYNVCVYLVNPTIASGTFASSEEDGTTTSPLAIGGKFKVCVSGTYTNGSNNVADAEYTSLDLLNPWAVVSDGYNFGSYQLGPNFGDVQINDAFVDWGPYNLQHSYCLTQFAALDGTFKLAVFDGDSHGPAQKESAWYPDNVGSLNYTVTYIGIGLP